MLETLFLKLRENIWITILQFEHTFSVDEVKIVAHYEMYLQLNKFGIININMVDNETKEKEKYSQFVIRQ